METSQLISSTNQWTGFYMMAILAFNDLNTTEKTLRSGYVFWLH